YPLPVRRPNSRAGHSTPSAPCGGVRPSYDLVMRSVARLVRSVTRAELRVVPADDLRGGADQPDPLRCLRGHRLSECVDPALRGVAAGEVESDGGYGVGVGDEFDVALHRHTAELVVGVAGLDQ